jgi:hypothetical protein
LLERACGFESLRPHSFGEMRAPEDVAAVLDLRTEGLTASEVARRTGIPRATVRDWLAGRVPRSAQRHEASCAACGRLAHRPEDLPPEYAYLLGLYLGDGCISTHPRGVYKLRVILDLRYPGIVDECEHAIRAVDPGRRVHRLNRRSNFTGRADSNVEVSAYSKAWPCLFPQHGPGRKHHRRIELADWQRELVERHPQRFLRGLVHSDGCRFMNTGRQWRHPRYSFSNRSADIRGIFCDACDLLDLHWTTTRHTVYVSRKADVAALDEFIGPKS